MVMIRREWLAGAMGGLLAGGAGAARPVGPDFEEVRLRGEAVRLVDLLEGLGLEVDPGPIAEQCVVRTDDGRVVPLLSGPASRALFTDARLRGRPTEVIGRRPEGLPYVDVILFRVEDESDGLLKVPEYYCDVCTIAVRYDQVCPCCRGAMELRFRPEG